MYAVDPLSVALASEDNKKLYNFSMPKQVKLLTMYLRFGTQHDLHQVVLSKGKAI